MNVVPISVQVPTGMLLMILALVTNGKSSIDAIIFVAPLRVGLGVAPSGDSQEICAYNRVSRIATIFDSNDFRLVLRLARG
jgi:hypothetical protein